MKNILLQIFIQNGTGVPGILIVIQFQTQRLLGKRIAFCASPSEWSFVSVTKKTGQEEKIRLVLFRDPYDIIFEPFFDDLKRLAKFAV